MLPLCGVEQLKQLRSRPWRLTVARQLQYQCAVFELHRQFRGGKVSAEGTATDRLAEQSWLREKIGEGCQFGWRDAGAEENGAVAVLSQELAFGEKLYAFHRTARLTGYLGFCNSYEISRRVLRCGRMCKLNREDKRHGRGIRPPPCAWPFHRRFLARAA